MADYIEKYLKELVQAQGGVVELQRGELAEQFSCVPSQINYVLTTRFTPERGYLVESRRGGGGYIRIIRLNLDTQADLQRMLAGPLGEHLAQDEAYGIIQRLLEEGFLSQREAALMQAAMQRETIALDLPMRDRIRSNLLKAMLVAMLRF